MADKEKIAELLHDVYAKGFWRYSNGDDGHDMTPEDIADYLVENGVMIQRWIPVADRLPGEDGTYIVRTTSGAVTTGRFYAEMIFEPTHYRDTVYVRVAGWSRNRNVTHWMPLPEPPKEESK